MTTQNTDPTILDSMPGYDVYGFPTGAEELPEETCNSIDSPIDPDGFPCNCGRRGCIGNTLPYNPYL